MSLKPSTPDVFLYSSHHSGELTAIFGRQGNIKVWNCSSGKKSLEILSSKLGYYSVVKWSPLKLQVNAQSVQSIITTSLIDNVNDNIGYNVMAFGTHLGCIGLLNDVTGKVISYNSSVHSSTVTDIVWSNDSTRLYSCAENDKLIMVWELTNSNGLAHISTIKCGKKFVTKLAISADNTLLFGGGTNIKCWDLDSGDVVYKFTGHSNSINSLDIYMYNFTPLYLISSACMDRIVMLWSLNITDNDNDNNNNNNNNNSLSLRIPHQPIAIKCIDGHICVLGSNGYLYVYSISTQNFSKKPQSPNSIIQIIPKSETTLCNNNQSIPILSFHYFNDNQFMFIYGNHSRPIFENVSCDFSQKLITLERNINISASHINESESGVCGVKISNPAKTQLATVKETHKLKRKRSKSETNDRVDEDLNLEDVLKSFTKISKNSTEEHMTNKLTTGTMIQMLCQGLQSGDSGLIDQVLAVSALRSINLTVKHLPINFVIPLIDKLMNLIHTSPNRAPVLLSWIKPCLTHHVSYLVTVPDLTTRIGLLYEILEARSANFDKLSHLQGKLDLLVNQAEPEITNASPIKPKLIYEDDDDSSISDVELSEYQELSSPLRDDDHTGDEQHSSPESMI